jgi:hypothetical protein
METILAFGLGVIMSPWVFGSLIILALWAESLDNHKTTAFFVALGLVSSYFMFNISLVYLLAYIPVGMLWSVWRWKIHCKKATIRASLRKADVTERGTIGSQRNRLEKEVNLKDNVDKIVSWIVCFPVSVLEQVVGDVVLMLKVIVTEWFAKVYTLSSNKALDDFDKSI